MTVGITGSSGTLGRILRQRLSAEPDEVRCFDGDLRSAMQVEDWVREVRPGRLIHLAARVPLDAVARDPLTALEVNVLGTAHVAAALARLGSSPWLFYASTSHVYASLDRKIGEDDALQPQNTYAETKRLGEEIVLFHARHGSLRVCVGRIFSFYHPSQKKPFLYPSIVERLASHDPTQPFALRGGNDVRDLSSAEEVVDAILRLLERECQGIVNIGSGAGTRIADFVRRLAGADLEIVVPDEDRPTSLVADVSRLRSLVGHD